MSGSKFIFDEKLLQAGSLYHCTATKEGLFCESIGRNDAESKAIYISSPLDSGKKGSIWNRIVFELEEQKDATYTICCFAVDSLWVEQKEERWDIAVFLKEESIPVHEKQALFESFHCVTVRNQKDIFLTEQKGRYFFFLLEYSFFSKKHILINSICVSCNEKQIIEYLPQFYREGNDFLKRFLGIFQSMLYDFQEKIEDSVTYLDLDSTTGEHLWWLSQWVCSVCPTTWNDEKIRAFAKISFQLYQEKGTKRGIERLIDFFTKDRPIILEIWEIMEYLGENFYKFQYHHLFGDNRYSFWILLRETEKTTQNTVEELEMILEHFCPANTKPYVLLLKNSIILGSHCYIGINSVISGNTEYVLGDTEVQPFSLTKLY